MEESAMVLEPARERLKKLSAIASRLNENTDHFTQELKTIEAELNALNVGVECVLSEPMSVSEPFDKFNDEGEPIGTFWTAHYLGYGKDHRGAWCLVVREYEEQLDTSIVNAFRPFNSVLQDSTPILQASRELRIKAAESILSLLDLIGAEAEKKIASLKKVMDRPDVPTILKRAEQSLRDSVRKPNDKTKS